MTDKVQPCLRCGFKYNDIDVMFWNQGGYKVNYCLNCGQKLPRLDMINKIDSEGLL